MIVFGSRFARRDLKTLRVWMKRRCDIIVNLLSRALCGISVRRILISFTDDGETDAVVRMSGFLLHCLGSGFGLKTFKYV